MCGIIGEVAKDRGCSTNDFSLRQKTIFHRGPDSSGFLELSNGLVRFGHQRLSIIDLSERASQPMVIDGYCLVYNGEIYNFKELKEELSGTFFSESDTEVVLRGYMQYGPEFFKRLNGMFAFALYDPKREVIVLARDQFGVKPLFYSASSDVFSFGSQLSAVAIKEKVLNPEAVRQFLAQGYVYGEESIYKGVCSLPPGSYGEVDIKTLGFKYQPYFKDIYQREEMSWEQALRATDAALEKSVKNSLISDVPIGVFLSGGIDSPLIAYYARELHGPIRSFSIQFDDGRFDESHRAERIAKHLGLEHTTFKVSTKEIIDSIPEILASVGEPLGDSSVIPTYFLSKFTRNEVKVCLSGDGADELFGGYPLYYLPHLAKLYQDLSGPRLLPSLINSLRPTYGKMGKDFKLKQFAYGAGFRDPLKAHFMYRGLRRLGITELDTIDSISGEEIKNWPIAEQLMYLDRKTVMPNDYLVKVDRLSMAHSMEVRVPFLNREVFELAARMPHEYKIKGFTTKLILRKLLETHLPAEFARGPKSGFSFPVSDWLRNDLKEYMLSLLTEANIDKIPGLSYSSVKKMISDHIEGRDDCGRELWALISLVHFISKN